MIQASLERIDLWHRQIADLDRQLGALVAPLRPPIEPLTSLPGVDETAAREMLAEIGTARRRLGSSARLASWAGGCPGHNASAGKRRRGQARKGNRSVRRVLGQCAWAARQTPTDLGRTFRRLAVRLGGKKAAVAVGHTIWVLVYPLLTEGTGDDEARDDRRQPRQEAQPRHRAIQGLERLGSHVHVARVAESEASRPTGEPEPEGRRTGWGNADTA